MPSNSFVLPNITEYHAAHGAASSDFGLHYLLAGRRDCARAMELAQWKLEARGPT